MDGTTSAMRGGVNEFLLDSRAPGGSGSSIKGNEEISYPRPPSSIGSVSSSNFKSEDSMYYAEEERQREAQIEKQVNALLEETRIWRLANSAQWVAWGIVQATVPELDDKDDDVPSSPDTVTDTIELVTSPAPLAESNENNSHVTEKRPQGLHAEALKDGESEKKIEHDADVEEEEDEFDYLAYAQHRALFFWGDVVALGLMKREELPDSCFAEEGPVTVEY
jgi:choline kinase